MVVTTLALAAAAPCCLAAPELWREAALLDKIVYKNANQHASSRHFHRLLEVRQAGGRAMTLPAAV